MSGLTPERVRELLSKATPGIWYPSPHVHGADGCKCLSCDDPPVGWLVDHDRTLDCGERVSVRRADGETNDFGRDLASCSDGAPLLPYDDAALAALAPDLAQAYLDLTAELERLRGPAARAIPIDSHCVGDECRDGHA